MRVRVSPCTLIVSLIAWGVSLWADRGSPNDGAVVSNAALGSGIISVIGNFVFSLFRNDPGSTGATVGRAILNLQDDLADLGGSLKDFVGEMRDWLGTLVGLLKRFRDNALVPLLKWLREKMRWLKEWLRRAFGPLLKILEKIRTYVLDAYTKFVRPILDVIAVVRLFLQTLDRLGVEWAGEIDTRLGKIENAITSNFQVLLGHLNKVIDTVDSVITLDLLFQRVPFLRTLERDIAPLWRLLLGARARTEKTAPIELGRTVDEIRADTEQFLMTGAGYYEPITREMGAIWRGYLRP